jgi:hypothetical protein
MQDPVLLGLEIRVGGLLPGLDHLKGHALLVEQGAQALMADVVDHPLSDQEVGQLGQRPGREGQIMVDRPGQRGLLDLAPLDEGEGGRAAAGIARIQRVEPIEVEVVQHIADPVGAGEGHLGDHRDVHGLGAEQDHLRPPPGHHRPGAAPHDTQQPVALLIGDVRTRTRSATRLLRRLDVAGSLHQDAPGACDQLFQANRANVAGRSTSLLTLEASSIWTDPDGSRQIVWMIKRMIKRRDTGSSPTQTTATTGGAGTRSSIW